MFTGFRLPLALTMLAAALLITAAPAFAQTKIKKEPVRPITDVAGAATFNAYCTVCHGPAGKGDGPAAKAFTTPPADLTLIAKRNNGKFPDATVRMHISGDTVVAAHGTRDMPTWGPVLRSTDGDAVALRLKNLVDFIESIQQK
jgi:mono/diheme cytochrome c family protein